MPTKIKICGLFRDDDARYANEAQPDFAGFIISYPKSHRNVTADMAAHLREIIDSSIKTVGVFVNSPEEDAAALANSGVIDIIQLHGQEDDEYIRRLRSLTNAEIWKSFIVKNKSDISAAQSCIADRILLDGGFGGGVTFDHTLLDEIRREFILAGGLNEQNITSALRSLRPWAADVSSGCETNKLKDRKKMIRIVEAVRKTKY